MTPPAVLFSPRPDFSDPWKESLEWMTDVITADNDTEQRVLLRGKPRRTLEFSVKPLVSRETDLLDNLIWGNQPTLMGVPVWPDACWIGGAVSATGTAVTVDTTYGGTVNREFVVGGYVALWRDPFTWEIVTVTGVTPPGTLAVTALANNWALGTTVVPVTLGTLKSELKRRRLAGHIGQVPITITCDVLADTAMVSKATWSGIQYLGVDFLTAVIVNGHAPTSTFRRTMLLEESLAGVYAYFAPNYAPVVTRDFEWFLKGRTAIAQFKGFLSNRQGRYNAFWAPTGWKDLTLTTAILNTDTTLTIASCGYANYVFRTDAARRYLALISPGLAVTPLFVIQAVDNNNGTETLTVSAPVGTAFPLSTTVSYLTPCRLEADKTVLEYQNAQLVRVATPFVETLTEVPPPLSGSGPPPPGPPPGPLSGDMVYIAPGGYLYATVPALAGGGAGLATLAIRMRFLVDPLYAVAANTRAQIGMFSVSGGGGTAIDIWAGFIAPNIVRFHATVNNGVANFDLFDVAATALPPLGSRLILNAAYSSSIGFAVTLTDDNGVVYGTFSSPNGGYIGTGNTPAATTLLSISYSVGTSNYGDITIDGVEVQTPSIASNAAMTAVVSNTAVPLITDPSVIALYSFDGSNLNAVASIGPNLSQQPGSGAPPVPAIFIAGGTWMASPY